jgi:hypothetical protein
LVADTASTPWLLVAVVAEADTPATLEPSLDEAPAEVDSPPIEPEGTTDVETMTGAETLLEAELVADALIGPTLPDGTPLGTDDGALESLAAAVGATELPVVLAPDGPAMLR